MDALDKARSVIRLEIDGLEAMRERLDESFTEVVGILNHAITHRGKIVVVGVGKSGNIGHKIAATFNSTGSTAVVLNSQNALHGDLGLLSDGDAVLALSYSGETSELLDLLPFVKRFDVKLIALTGKVASTLGRHSDVVLDTSVAREACPLNLAPTASSTCMLVMGDALAMVLLETRGFTGEDFAKFHPGGALGRALLTKVSDIMRKGDHVATIPPTATVTDAITAMSRARSGACIVVEPDGTLAGIFTHGDFARAFQTAPDLGGRPISEFMTRGPISISAEALAAEALQVIGQNRIDDLVVIGTDGLPVGLVDSQDLARLKIV
jgi:arabinose-5-phosphate isomerase